MKHLRPRSTRPDTLFPYTTLLIANNQHGTDDPPITSGLDEQAVMKLVQQTLNQNKQSETIKSNQSKVQEALKAKFGDKAQEAVAAKAAELGVSPSELGDLEIGRAND